MPHTKARYQQDMPFTDGRIFCGPGDIVWDIAAQGGVSRTAAGQWGILHPSAANTTNFAVNLTNMILRRLGFFEDLQEQFGGAGIAASAEYQGRPDALASMAKGQPITPRTAFKVKGFLLTGFDVIYTITNTALTAHTCRVDTTQYVNNVAAAMTAVLATGANGLQTATQANPYLTSVAILAANQTYYNLADQAVWVEVAANAQGASVYTLIG